MIIIHLLKLTQCYLLHSQVSGMILLLLHLYAVPVAEKYKIKPGNKKSNSQLIVNAKLHTVQCTISDDMLEIVFHLKSL